MKIIQGERDKLVKEAMEQLLHFAITGDREAKQRLLALDHTLSRRSQLIPVLDAVPSNKS